MDIQFDKIDNTEALIKVRVSESDYHPKVEEKIKEYSRKASIKGFRPGKIPQGLIRKMYGKSIMVEEVNEITTAAVSNYIKDNDLHILASPSPNFEKASEIDWENQKEFEFEYNVALVSSFSLNLSKEMVITSHSLKYDDKVIDEAIENLREHKSEETEIEISENGDFLYGKMMLKNGEEKRSMIDTKAVAPEKVAAFLGVTKGSVISFDMKQLIEGENNFPGVIRNYEATSDSPNEYLNFTVDKVVRRTKPELDLEFFNKIFPNKNITTREEFYESVRERVISDNKTGEREELNLMIKKEVLKSTSIELPKRMLKEWFLNGHNRGASTLEGLEAAYEQHIDTLKWSLIEEKIIKQEQINISGDEVLEEAKQEMKASLIRAGMFEGVDDETLEYFALKFLDREKEDTKTIIYRRLFTQQVLDYIKSQITINHQEVTLEEYKNLS